MCLSLHILLSVCIFFSGGGSPTTTARVHPSALSVPCFSPRAALRIAARERSAIRCCWGFAGVVLGFWGGAGGRRTAEGGFWAEDLVGTATGSCSEQCGAVKREQNEWFVWGWLSQVVLVPLGKHISPTDVFYQEGNQSLNLPRRLLCYLEGAWPLREAPQCGYHARGGFQSLLEAQENSLEIYSY